MNTSDVVRFIDFPCADTNRQGYQVPGIAITPPSVSILHNSAAAPLDSGELGAILTTSVKTARENLDRRGPTQYTRLHNLDF
jgi:hypothetical protein